MCNVSHARNKTDDSAIDEIIKQGKEGIRANKDASNDFICWEKYYAQIIKKYTPLGSGGGSIMVIIEIKDLEIQEKNHYVIRYDGWIFIIMLIDFVLFGAILIVSQTSDQSEIITTIVFGLFALAGLYGMLSVVLYRVEVKGEEIKYRSPVGITKYYTFSIKMIGFPILILLRQDSICPKTAGSGVRA